MLSSRYVELILYKTYADLRAEAAKTYIGFLWWVLDPIIFMLIFYVVFGLLFQRGTENFVPFLLTGLVSWRWFQNTISHSANTILGNHALMRQVYRNCSKTPGNWIKQKYHFIVFVDNFFRKMKFTRS